MSADIRGILVRYLLLSTALMMFISGIPAALGQTSQLKLRFPDGSDTGIASTCFENQPCELDSETIKSICTQEGTYSLIFLSHLPDASTGKWPDIDAHTVNWDWQRYCSAGCTNQNVRYSTTAQFCCGAHRAGDCAFRYGNELCVDTSANTWEWGNVLTNIGDIYDPLCAKASFVSNGQNFYACGDTTAAKTPSLLADRLTITRTGVSRPHDYVCAKLKPDDPDSVRTWVECHGNDDIMTRKQGKTAETGVAIGYGLLYSKKVSVSETVELTKPFPGTPSKGTIELQIRPSWPGNDGTVHTLFQYIVDDNNLMKIAKNSDNTFSCQWRNSGANHNPESFNIAGWKAGEMHIARMSFDTSTGKVNCTLDGASKEASGAGQIAGGGKATINSAPLGAVPGKAEMLVKISDVINPTTLYCTQDSRFLSDLDINEKSACSEARLTWTGSKCCSEDEDKPNEFYNDPDPRSTPPQSTGATGGASTGGTGSTDTGGTGGTTPGGATEGISFPTGGAIMIIPPASYPPAIQTGAKAGIRSIPQRAYTPTGAFIAVSGMQTATTGTVQPAPICPVPPYTPPACPTVTPPNPADCPLGTPVPTVGQDGCPTGQYTCSAWKPTSPGSCWNSTYLRNGQTSPGTYDKVLTVQGRLLGCLINGSSPTGTPPGDPNLFQLTDKHTNSQLITEVKPCTLAINLFGIEHNNRYCSLKTRNWQQTELSIPRSVSEDPTNSSNQECCPSGMCWNGLQCIDNQRCDSTTANTRGWRCIDGKWSKPALLYTPDRKDMGYCPNPTMCLVNPNGNMQNIDKPMTYFSQDPTKQPTCLNQSQYLLNSICHLKVGAASLPSGSQLTEWKSRASLIALQLAEIGQNTPPGKYAVFCGASFDDVLNFVDYEPTIGSGSIRNYLTTPCLINEMQAPCVNTFCAMRLSDNRIAFGTSTNVPINDPAKSFLLALGHGANKCAGAMQEDGRYHSCGDGVYYNNLTASIIVMLSSLNMPQSTAEDLIRIQQPLLITSRKELLSSFMNRPSLSTRKPFFDQTSMFGEIFIYRDRDQGKNYFGMLERDQFNETSLDYVGLVYEGFPVVDPVTQKKPCDMIRDKILSSNLLEQDCEFTTANTLKYMAFSKSQQAGAESPLRQFWRDLSAKLR